MFEVKLIRDLDMDETMARYYRALEERDLKRRIEFLRYGVIKTVETMNAEELLALVEHLGWDKS